MDMVTLRSVMTVVALVVFLGIIAWAWSSRRKPEFDEAARLPFDDEDSEIAQAGRAPK
jgi:cytochrome c oxidase cbb3-type subunit 4